MKDLLVMMEELEVMELKVTKETLDLMPIHMVFTSTKLSLFVFVQLLIKLQFNIFKGIEGKKVKQEKKDWTVVKVIKVNKVKMEHMVVKGRKEFKVEFR